MGFKRGSLVKHKKYGLCYIGGTKNGKISLHDLSNGERLSQSVKNGDFKFLTFNTYRNT